MFHSMLYGGLKILDKDLNYENPRQSQILSMTQVKAYGVSEGKKWTSKHVGLGSTLHKSTRSKKLVNLFHQCTQCIYLLTFLIFFLTNMKMFKIITIIFYLLLLMCFEMKH